MLRNWERFYRTLAFFAPRAESERCLNRAAIYRNLGAETRRGPCRTLGSAELEFVLMPVVSQHFQCLLRHNKEEEGAVPSAHPCNPDTGKFLSVTFGRGCWTDVVTGLPIC